MHACCQQNTQKTPKRTESFQNYIVLEWDQTEDQLKKKMRNNLIIKINISYDEAANQAINQCREFIILKKSLHRIIRHSS